MVCILLTLGIALVLAGILGALRQLDQRTGRTRNARLALRIATIVCGLALLILSTLPHVADFSRTTGTLIAG